MDQASATTGASENDIYANPPDVTELELEPGHPGLGDAAYIARREALFALCREHRLKNLGPPRIQYTDEEQRIWREVSPQLAALHVSHASRIYLQAKRDLGISADEIPQLRDLSDRVQERSGMHLVPRKGRSRIARSTPTSPNAASRSRSSSGTAASPSSRPSPT